MPDYIYLLENRLSPAQQNALKQVRDAARDAGMTVFLTGGAVRDLTSGSPVRDLDVSIQGNALKLKKKLANKRVALWGENEKSQTLFFRFPGGVRVEVSSTRREEFPKPGVAVYHPASILEDLRRRDFTANAMALSLNDGSYGLLMDPLNGVADLEARLLRLVSNYGFLEDPARLIRAARLSARLGWEMEERTKTRFENAREENVIQHISPYQRGYEVEEIVHEEDGLKILKALEADGWMKHLVPAWTSAKADVERLNEMREVLVQLQMQGVNPDSSAAQAQLLTAKMSPKDLTGLKKMLVRPGFVREWESLETRVKDFARQLLSKDMASPSATWKLFTSADPEAILWLGLTSKNAQIQEKYQNFFSVWPEARQRIPYALMQEMRIVPELEGYQGLLRGIFLELIDARLTSDEEMRAFLEPHSPPAPPPPVSIRRTRAKKQAGPKIKETDEEEARESREEGEEEESDETGSAAARRDFERREAPVRAAILEAPPALAAIQVAPPVAADKTTSPKPPSRQKAVESGVGKSNSLKEAKKAGVKSEKPQKAAKPEAKRVATSAGRTRQKTSHKPAPAKAAKASPAKAAKPVAKKQAPARKMTLGSAAKSKLRKAATKPKAVAKAKKTAKPVVAKKKAGGSAKAVLARRKR